MELRSYVPIIVPASTIPLATDCSVEDKHFCNRYCYDEYIEQQKKDEKELEEYINSKNSTTAKTNNDFKKVCPECNSDNIGFGADEYFCNDCDYRWDIGGKPIPKL